MIDTLRDQMIRADFHIGEDSPELAVAIIENLYIILQGVNIWD